MKSLSLLDGSHKFVATYTGTYRERLTITDGASAETAALCNFMEKFSNTDILAVSLFESIAI